MEPITKQEMFNAVWHWFITEKKPPSTLTEVNDLGEELQTCVYRHPDDPNKRCAIGCAMPDDLYRESFEWNGITYLADAYEDVGKWLEEALPLASDLQTTHDAYAKHENFHSLMEEGLRRLAVQHGLEVPTS